MSPDSLHQLLGYAAQGCRTVDLDATPEELDRLTEGCNVVAFEVDGLRERIERAGKKVNDHPTPIPTKPLPQRPKPVVHPKPKPKPKEDQ